MSDASWLTFSLPPEGDHGPFNSLTELMQHPAHLAVFLNYVISNSDPNPLLFYLIIDAYKSGSVKEMRKWAYEIHSCFLVILTHIYSVTSRNEDHIFTMIALDVLITLAIIFE